MWKRPSHRNQKICPGYVPEMPFAFSLMCMAISDHVQREWSGIRSLFCRGRRVDVNYLLISFDIFV